jgi:TonB-linked SusC/RagA family outer membrane protein
MMNLCTNSIFSLKNALLLLSFFIGAGGMFAQKQITGVVTDKGGEPLISANVYVKSDPGSGTITDLDGKFELSVSESAKKLVVSYIGFSKKELKIGDKDYFEVMLSDQVELDEVVVTALGVEREEKALGYSVQTLGAGDISDVKPNNVTNALAGKSAGVFVTGSSAGPTASSNINIRGAASLLGNNQPLFVVNGMPITNDLYAIDDGLNGSTTIDFGNAAQLVNPDDIETMNILKGPAASALYGSRAADGVILIETKTGKKAEGWGVELNSTTNFQSVLKYPNYQNTYGFGGGGKYSYLDGSNYIGDKEYYEAYGENWGPEMNGQLIKQFNSDGEAVPYTPAPDNIRNFYRTGVTGINNIAINNNSEDGDFRFSYTNLSNQGIIPNTNLRRNTFQTSVGRTLFDDKLKIRANGMFISSGSDNIPNAGYDESSSIMYGWLWYPRQVEIDDLRDYWQPGMEGRQQRYVEGLWVNNPWFVANENTNSFQNTRMIGNVKMLYDFNDNFFARFRFGADINEEQRQFRRAPSTRSVLLGSYREDEISFSETNTELLLGYSSTRSNDRDFAFDIKVGGNIMQQQANILVANNPQLQFFGTSESVYTLTNSRSGVLVESQKTEFGINSLFGLATVSYKDFLYLDASYRNDWNSSLVNPIVGIDNSEYSFGYPAVSVSAVLNEALNIPTNSAISFLKIRGGYAEVGSGAPPYAFNRTFTPRPSFGSNPIFTTNRTIGDQGLTNERTEAYEFGTDIRLFNNRLRFDATYYDMLSFNQIINLPVATSSGYDFRLTNGGEIRNRGVELMISARAIERGDFSWDITLNAGHNRAVVESLPDEISGGRFSIVADVFPGDEGGADLEYVAEEGELLGQLYGLGFERGPDGRIIHQDGLPIHTTEKVSAGSYQPDLRLGVYNTFKYKNFSFGFLIDGQIGGNIYSRSHALYNTSGTITNEDEPNLKRLDENGNPVTFNTLDNRTVYSVSYDNAGDPVYTLEQEGGVIGYGWKRNEDGQLVENDVEVEPGGAGYTGYFYNYYGNGFNRDNIEAATYDATYFKLRELNIGYNLPQRIVERFGMTKLRVSIVGRNLLLWSNVPSIDPETYSIRNGIFVPGFESTQLPPMRQIGFSVSVGF